MVAVQRKRVILGLLIILAAVAGLTCTSIYSIEKPSVIPLAQEQNAKFSSDRFVKLSDFPSQEPQCVTGLQFVNENDGWTFCDGTLWSSSDGGKNWQKIFENDDLDSYTTEIHFISPRVGWKNTRDTLHKTEDGGRTWILLNIPFQAGKGDIGSIHILDAGKQIWLAGGIAVPISSIQLDKTPIAKPYFRGDGTVSKRVIFHSIDGGKTWKQETIESPVGSGCGVYISPDGKIWAIDDTHMFHLKEGQWKKVDFTKSKCVNHYLLEATTTGDRYGDLYGITDLTFADGSNGWIGFENGYMAKTTDGGQTWCDLLPPNTLKDETGLRLFFFHIYFADANHGWGLATSDKLYETNDGGRTWSRIDSDVKFSYMYFLDAKHGWAIAKEGVFRIAL